ncbi:MAG: hypothetical protein DRQ40_09605 [Gammaproteobacteria bacterium]|nr:MAG: hypothetical protein DRQ40_09605 [Gammaproteobacteria bacterium]
MKQKHIFLLVLFSVGIKLVYCGVNLYIEKSGGSRTFLQNYYQVSKKNDSYWYQGIAIVGYDKVNTREDLGYVRVDGFKQSNWAFFPFYPMMNRFLMRTAGMNFDESASIISLVFSTLAMIGIYWFCCLYFGDSRHSLYATLLFFSFPYSFYFSMFYTEAVFLSVLIFSFVVIHSNRTYFLIPLLVPLVLLRPNGVVFLIPLYLYYLERSGLIRSLRIDWKGIFRLENLRRSLVFASGPLAFTGYCIYQYVVTGYFFAFSIAQVGWFRDVGSPWAPLFKGEGFVYDFNSAYTILAIVVAVMMFKKMPLSLNVLVWSSILLPLTSGSVISMPRYISVVFPLFMFLSGHFYRSEGRNFLLAAVFFLQLASLFPWIKLYPLGY